MYDVCLRARACVRARVCAFACVCVRMRASAHKCVRLHAIAYIFVRVCSCTRVCAHSLVHVRERVVGVHIRAHVCVGMCVFQRTSSNARQSAQQCPVINNKGKIKKILIAPYNLRIYLL